MLLTQQFLYGADMTDRFFTASFYVISLGLAGGAALFFIIGFVEYLQVGRWPAHSLLQLAYDADLIRARWFLANQWSWPVHDVLAKIPVTLAMLSVAPLFWWLGGIFGRR
jgi:hypothetical protein